MTPAGEQPTIDHNVDYDDHASKHKLNISSEAQGIDNVQNVVLYEALRIAGLARFDAEVVLHVCKWTVSAGELDKESPCGCWSMNKWDPTPPQRHCGTEKGEQDESQME